MQPYIKYTFFASCFCTLAIGLFLSVRAISQDTTTRQFVIETLNLKETGQHYDISIKLPVHPFLNQDKRFLKLKDQILLEDTQSIQNLADELIEKSTKPNISSCFNQQNNPFGILSLSIEYYSYTGGAHGHTQIFTFNYTTDGQPIALKDIFHKSEIHQLLKLFETTLQARNTLPFEDPDYIELFDNQKNLIGFDVENIAFLFHEDDIIFILPPYTVAPYSQGNVELAYPLESLKDQLDHDFIAQYLTTQAISTVPATSVVAHESQ